MRRVAGLLTFTVLLSGAVAVAQEHKEHGSMIAASPQWEKLKSLVGEWDGYMQEGEQKYPTHISVRMTGDGSAVMHWMDAGGPHEMVTMFHMDKDELVATHYCAAHNQPRFRALPAAEANRIAFDFKDGTNIRPGDGYMRKLTLIFVDADHHDEEWGYDQGGTVNAGMFHLTRAKTASGK
jgi:hypothetical protein